MAWSYNEVYNFVLYDSLGLELIYIVCRHHMKTMLKWRENNQSIELMAIREVHLNMELNNNTSSTNNLVHVL